MELMTSLIDLQPSFVLLVAPVAVGSKRPSQFQTMSCFHRLYSHCHSVKVFAVGENQTAYSTGSGIKYGLIKQLRMIKLHKDEATCFSTELIAIFLCFRRCSRSCRTKHSLFLMLCSCEHLLHLNVRRNASQTLRSRLNTFQMTRDDIRRPR